MPPDDPRTRENAARERRLEEALRQNLRRRKAQIRQRGEAGMAQAPQVEVETTIPAGAKGDARVRGEARVQTGRRPSEGDPSGDD